MTSIKKAKGGNAKNTNNIQIDSNNKSQNEIYILIYDKITYIQEIIQNTILSVQNYKRYDIFSNSDLNICMSSLNELYQKTVSLHNSIQVGMNKTSTSEQNVVVCIAEPEPGRNDNISNSEIGTNLSNAHQVVGERLNAVPLGTSAKEFDLAIDLLQQIIDKLSIVICGFGTQNMDDLLYITSGQEFKNKNIEPILLQEKYEIIRKYVHPIGYKTINWKAQRQGKSKDANQSTFCVDKTTEETIILELANNLECFDNDMTSKSMYFKIHGVRVVIQNEKIRKTFIIYGIVDDISPDWINNKYVETRSKYLHENIPSNKLIEPAVMLRIIDTLTLKDYLVCGNNDIFKRHVGMMSDVNYVKTNKLDILIRKFINMELCSQRNMLMNLLIYNSDDEIQYIAYLLYDLLAEPNSEVVDSREQITIYDSFPWKIKMYFKDTMNLTIKYAQKMTQKYDINRVSIEQQIYLLKVPERVKEKAMVKIKEIKGKSDESGIKAKQYLEGLLKIPFGIIKEEPILQKVKIINSEFFKILEKMYAFVEIANMIQKKTKYTNIEILKYIDIINDFINTKLSNEMKTMIDKLNSKQLSAIMNYIQIVNKNGETQMMSTALTKVNLKAEKKQTICAFIDATQNQTLYKTSIYDIIHQAGESCTLTQMTNNIHKLNTNIVDIEKSMNGVISALDESIYGHDNAKNQILKIIGQWMSGKSSGYCFGFEGSPGIGKTSLAKKGLSNCLKDEDGNSRAFSFIALGGSCNGSTLEGHSYTYVNSTWGRIVDILMDTKCMNPIIYIDELDKVSKTEHGKEIIGILTHLIDTTQNDVFQDKYFSGIDIDLSKVLFIFSYNDPEQIDRILLDRIHRIKFDNLSLEDKKVVLTKYILPEINEKMGWSNIVELSDQMIEYIIENYTMEPGVRKLKEIIFDLYGEINIEILKCKSAHSIELPIRPTAEQIDTKYLKKYHKVQEKMIHPTSEIGIINGLWANSMGNGGIIQIETMFFPSNAFLELKLTGLQGDVMKESMNVAKSLAWSITPDQVKKDFIELCDKNKSVSQGLHIHCPDGAVSKDGPSAGTAITLAMYSLFNKIPINNTTAITGEINLRGDITAIGGLDSKILGGIRAGVKTFLYPESNHRDFQDFMEKNIGNPVLTNIKFVEVSKIEQTFEHVF
jgi:ATP-dependent Lon protease